MHELGITRNIVAIVGDAAKGRAGSAIAFCFETVAQGTALEGAMLEIRQIEDRARRQACGVEFVTETLFLCACGSRQFARLQGEELNIKSMELEAEIA